MRSAGLAFLALFMGLSVSAAKAEPTTWPRLAQTPTPDEIERFYPLLPRQLQITGGANIRCMVSADGVGHECQALAESPPGLGFGAAAAKLGETFHFTTAPAGPNTGDKPWFTRVRFSLADNDTPDPDPPEPPKVEPSPEMLELADRFIAENNPDLSVEKSAETNAATIREMCVSGGGLYCDKLVAAAKDAFKADILAARHTMTVQIANLYAEDELRALIAFFETPVGKSLREKQVQMATIMAGLQAEMARDVYTHLGERYCAAVGCTTLGDPRADAKTVSTP